MSAKAEKIAQEYLLQRELYRDFSQVIRGIINQLLLDTEIKIYYISAREKDPKKLTEKIERKEKEGKNYKKLTDIEDLAGVRVVTYLESQKKKVVGLIYGEFEKSNPQVIDKYEPKGYRSTHIVLSLNPERETFAEYKRYKGLKCEVQVTSALYHTWSEVEHDIIYKPGADRDKLGTLGLDEIEQAFEKIMSEHIEQAAIHFDHIYQKHKDILRAGQLFFSDYLTDIKASKTNDEIISLLEIADKFSHKKNPDCIRMVETVLNMRPISPKLIGEFGDTKIYGKENVSVLEKCLDILAHFHIRYSDPAKVLKLLFKLSTNKSDKIASRAIKVLEELVSYNGLFIEKYKNIYPQIQALKFIKTIPAKSRKQNITFISTILREVLSTSTEATYSSKVDELTHRTGSLSPNENLIRLRRDSIEFTTKILKAMKDPKSRLELMRVLTSSLLTPMSAAAPDSLIQMLIEDSKIISKIFRNLVLTGGKVKNYPLALEAEEELNRLLRSERFDATDEVKELYDDLQRDPEYSIFCTLVGDIRKYKTPDEEWHLAEQRRSEEIKKLVEETTARNIKLWQKRLKEYTKPLREGILDDWQFASLQTYINLLTSNKPRLALGLFEHALNSGSPLGSLTFVTSFLTTLRSSDHISIWDKFVQKINREKRSALVSAIVYSLNIPKGTPLSTVRKKDRTILSQIVEKGKPYNYSKDNDFRLRHSLIGTLCRLYSQAPSFFEKLIMREISTHPGMRHVYFNELPFASHRGWMKLSDWSKKGKEFISDQLVQVKSLDWHNQEMISEMHYDSLPSVLRIFLERIRKEEVHKREDGHYDAIPYDFNPDLRKYMAEHPDYSAEMVGWLSGMTPEWSKYNWEVAHFIQRVGGPSYQTILRALISKGDAESLKKATYALEGIDEPDFAICMEIAGQTSDKDIHSRLQTIMFATGVVMGEDGLARAMVAKAKVLEPYLKSKNKRVKKFAKKMKDYFDERSMAEFRDAAERRRLRELEFEG